MHVPPKRIEYKNGRTKETQKRVENQARTHKIREIKSTTCFHIETNKIGELYEYIHVKETIWRRKVRVTESTVKTPLVQFQTLCQGRCSMKETKMDRIKTENVEKRDSMETTKKAWTKEKKRHRELQHDEYTFTRMSSRKKKKKRS